MPIRLIYGIPRSGKTYYLVHTLIENYYDITSAGLIIIKEQYKHLKIISNIDGLRLPHENLDDLIKKAGGVDTFFSYEYQKKVSDKHPHIVYAIDEAQFYFPDNYRCNPVFNWFQMHGHMGQDIYILTQDIALVSSKITKLSELNLYALPQSTSLFGGKDLKYNVVSYGQIIDKKLLFKRQQVFEMYKSHDQRSVTKVKNPFIKYAVASILFFCLALGNFYYNFIYKKTKKVNKASAPQEQIVKPQEKVQEPKSTKQKSFFEKPSNEPKRFGELHEPELERVKLNYYMVGKRVYIMWNGRKYTWKTFPYQVEGDGLKNIYAYIPVDDLPQDDRKERIADSRNAYPINQYQARLP